MGVVTWYASNEHMVARGLHLSLLLRHALGTMRVIRTQDALHIPHLGSIHLGRGGLRGLRHIGTANKACPCEGRPPDEKH